MLNSINLVGRLTKEPELRKSNKNVSLVNFSVAVDNTRLEADGTRGTCFLDAVAFGSQAEAIAKSLRKGSKVAISGSLNQRNYIRQDGSKGRAYEINVDSIEFLDPKPVETEAPMNKLDSIDIPDDDLPFNEEETKPQEKVKQQKAEKAPKFDPYTGKPLTPKAKK